MNCCYRCLYPTITSFVGSYGNVTICKRQVLSRGFFFGGGLCLSGFHMYVLPYYIKPFSLYQTRIRLFHVLPPQFLMPIGRPPFPIYYLKSPLNPLRLYVSMLTLPRPNKPIMPIEPIAPTRPIDPAYLPMA